MVILMTDIRQGLVFDISRFCVDDGPGIRTTVFLKGCPLSCIWCHNPESQRFAREMSFDSDRCVLCRACEFSCPHACHRFHDGAHLYGRDGCVLCGKCADACLYGALRVVGAEMTVTQVIDKVARDILFYDESGGGMTLSGGEPLSQPGFSLSLLREAKQRNIHTCVETCGYSTRDALLALASFTDIFLYDLKQMDPGKHLGCTRVDNRLIIDNLIALDESGANSIVRLPVIPGCNDDEPHFQKAGALSMRLNNVLRIELLPYHPLGVSKHVRLGQRADYDNEEIPDATAKEQWLQTMKKYTDRDVVCR